MANVVLHRADGAPYNHPAARLRAAPLPFESRPCPDFATFARKTVNRTVHSGSFDRRGNSSRHDDASCRRSSHMSPSSCSSSWSREQEQRANSSVPRDCTSPNNVDAPRSAYSQEARCHRVPAFAFAWAACNLLPPRVTTSSTFFPGRLYYVLFRTGILKPPNAGCTILVRRKN